MEDLIKNRCNSLFADEENLEPVVRSSDLSGLLGCGLLHAYSDKMYEREADRGQRRL